MQKRLFINIGKQCPNNECLSAWFLLDYKSFHKQILQSIIIDCCNTTSTISTCTANLHNHQLTFNFMTDLYHTTYSLPYRISYQQYNSARPMQEAELFPRYMAHQLRPTLLATVVGKITEINNKRNSAILETDPQSKLNIEVLLGEQQSENFKVGKVYEMRGVCRSSKEMEMRGFTCFGVDFDLNSYNQMLLLATKEFRSIFYS